MTDPVFPPAGATDCHTHVAGGAPRYPMVSPRAYTPEEASPAMMRAMMDRVGTERIVLVQMSVFGTDNACMLDAMEVLGPCSRGVVQVAPDVAGAELDRMHSLGVRGIRVNLNTTGLNDPGLARARLATTAAQCARNGWHLQLFTSAAVIAELSADLQALPVPVVLDHFGLLPTRARGGAAEHAVLSLLGSGKGWVKISGTYRLDDPTATDAIAGLARDLHAANPGHIVWGSDWPHSPHHAGSAEVAPPAAPYRDIDPAAMLDTIRAWFDAPEVRKAVLTDNPARLYDF